MNPGLAVTEQGMTVEQLADFVAEQMMRLNLVLKNLDGLNIVDIKFDLKNGAYIQLNRKGIKFWDGENETFTVDIDGKVTMTGALVQSSTGYPRVELNNATNLIKAMADAANYVSLNPTIGGAPALAFYVDGILTSYLNTTSGGPLLTSFNSTDITLQPTKNLSLTVPGQLNINNKAGYSGPVLYVKSVASDGLGGVVSSYGELTFTKGILTGVT